MDLTDVLLHLQIAMQTLRHEGPKTDHFSWYGFVVSAQCFEG